MMIVANSLSRLSNYQPVNKLTEQNNQVHNLEPIHDLNEIDRDRIFDRDIPMRL